MNSIIKCLLVAFLMLTALPLPAQENNTINSPQMVSQLSDGRMLLHASTGKASGTEIAYMPEWKAFGWFRSDGKVEWEAIVDRSGRYSVYLEWSVSDEEAGKGFILQTGKQTIKGKVERSGSWETFKKIYIGNLKLKKGSHHFIFKPETDFGKGALLDLREIELAPVQAKN